MGLWIQKACLLTFLIGFVDCAPTAGADSTEIARQSDGWFAFHILPGVMGLLLISSFLLCCLGCWKKKTETSQMSPPQSDEVLGPETSQMSPPQSDEVLGPEASLMSPPQSDEEKLEKLASSYKVDVTLDVDTAHPNLHISEENKTVQWRDEAQRQWRDEALTQWRDKALRQWSDKALRQLSEKTQRQVNDEAQRQLRDEALRQWRDKALRQLNNEQHFNKDPYVLGTWGRTLRRLMRAYWEVCVEGKDDWVLGVALVTANRKGQLVLSPANGFWAIRLSNGQRLKAMDDEESLLNKTLPNKVSVYLDYIEKKVTFYNAEDGSLIHSFDDGPGYEDEVRPLFSTWNNDDVPIRILSSCSSNKTA